MSTRKIRSFEDLDAMKGNVDHVLTLFSGGLDSSYVLKELSQRKLRITALSVDVGEGCQIQDLKEIADFFGADLTIVDAREMFAHEAVAPAIRAQAKYLGMYPVSSSLSRPILAKVAVQVARELGCDAIVHTANQSQNSLRRLNGAIGQLGYSGCYGTPYERSILTRDEKIEVLRQLGLTRFQARGISGDANLWCREFESGSIDNPEGFWVPPSLFEWTRAPETSPKTREIQIDFRAGIPVAIDQQAIDLVPLIAYLNKTVGAYSIGRYSGLEHLEGGQKVLEVREAPAATILMDAYRQIETAVLDAELLREKVAVELLWTREAVEGRWFGPLRQCADAFIRMSSEKVTGTVVYSLRQGAMDLCSIKAPEPLYLTDRDAWEKSLIQDAFAPPARNARAPSEEEVAA
ncbi:argininosuccinate synthase [Variovorax boronicumulans]|uniref:argininosuccinate synthase-related protein n=1 Tax=Variovorax boronicumulans TaxID=436515 RepID=UPI002780D4DC|nr:argininosuccinate synthase-related protein [Variovorax boronicumulans]MDQ0012272.1 argininosuccinate synthase [Variovorax boronicumulans]